MDNKEKVLYDDGTHKCVMFSFDDESVEDAFLSVNQYLIVQNGIGVLVDPGSEAVFDELYEAVSQHVEIDKIKFIFFSHQDPDVSGSIAQWAISTQARFIMPSLWIRFMTHYGFMELSRVIALEDKGAKITFGEDFLQFVPAHFLHSPGNFSLYDSRSKIVFSGDIGAAIVETPEGYKKVSSFEEHVKHLLGFHKRYMGSNKLCRAWVARIQGLDVHMIAPQHGLVFEDDDVKYFLEWLKELQCGSDYLEELY
ncbi:MBL fold metallo-hydrolase [Sulfurimonas sp. SAG-AH-194-I05]|nr:MBL fold metallo-hydrolase [Sulfurimonas sp. SAG-AH-194-I05]MDF1875155.1 MBL fold metallo-hydrolase [Sulfurimonas sp. SAG-AH-194-I05]